ncbi:MAG: hypothetical protein RL653_1002 [Pseudomonadota bacterium]|jgi:hypothetical protein
MGEAWQAVHVTDTAIVLSTAAGSVERLRFGDDGDGEQWHLGRPLDGAWSVGNWVLAVLRDRTALQLLPGAAPRVVGRVHRLPSRREDVEDAPSLDLRGMLRFHAGSTWFIAHPSGRFEAGAAEDEVVGVTVDSTGGGLAWLLDGRVQPARGRAMKAVPGTSEERTSTVLQLVDGSVAVATYDSEVHRLDADGRLRASVSGPPEGVDDLVADGSRLGFWAAEDEDGGRVSGDLHIWEAGERRSRRVETCHRGALRAGLLRGDTAFTAGVDGTLRMTPLWRGRGVHRCLELPPAPWPSLSLDEGRLVVHAADWALWLNPASVPKARVEGSRPDRETASAVTASGFALGTITGALCCYDDRLRGERRTLHRSWITGLASQGTVLVTTSVDGECAVVEREGRGRVVRRVRPHGGARVWGARFLGQDTVLTWGGDGCAVRWNVRTGRVERRVRVSPDRDEWVTCAELDDGWIAAAGIFGHVATWKADQWSAVERYQLGDEAVSGFLRLPGGWLAWTRGGTVLRLERGRVVERWRHHAGDVTGVAWLTGGLASVGADGMLAVSLGRKRSRVRAFTGPALGLRRLEDGSLLTWGRDELAQFDSLTLACMARCPEHRAALERPAWLAARVPSTLRRGLQVAWPDGGARERALSAQEHLVYGAGWTSPAGMTGWVSLERLCVRGARPDGAVWLTDARGLPLLLLPGGQRTRAGS